MTSTASYVGRFAPSPTGPLHFGSLVACLASYLDARARSGIWLVRMEDVDTGRCRSAYAEDILATLRAFAFDWDGPVMVQSRQVARYQAALQRLAAHQLTFACSCTRREIADSSIAGVDGPIYPGTCRLRHLGDAGNAVRLRAPDEMICFVDRTQGRICQNLASDVGDFVLLRRDGLVAYQLAVVVDDADQGVTDVVRGADLLDSTARQICLQRALGLPTTTYLHLPVAVNEQGQKLSKQTLAPALSPAAASSLLVRALAFLGQPVPPGLEQRPPAEVLAEATVRWNPAAIPRLRSCHIQ